MKMVGKDELSDRPVITCIKKVNKKIQGENSSRADTGIGTGSDQRNMKKTSTKTNPTGYFSFGWGYIFINITVDCSFFLGL